MGMSASQMRFCMLTGKKADVEFQGQQINQQRTTLATETSSYNAKLLDLSVPTPPSASDYTTTTYTSTISGTTYTLGTMTEEFNTDKTSKGTYTVDYTKIDKSTLGVDSTKDNIYTRSVDATTGAVSYTATIDGSHIPLSAVSKTSIDAGIIYDGIPAIKDKQLYSYQTTENGNTVTKYVTQENLDAFAAESDRSGTAIQSYIRSSNAEKTVSDKFTGVKVTWSSSGRLDSLEISGTPYKINSTTSNDEEGYNDAMNEYEYQKNLYEQEMNDINAKICVVESEDKKLELKLKDLDTQQEALNTEMDSVKKVIDKNIESGFKAFA